MIDALNFFHHWLNAHHTILKDPIPSLAFDEAMSKTSIQLAMSHSVSNRVLFSLIEERIASDYATLIDFQLRTLRQPFKAAHIIAAVKYEPPVERIEEESDLSSPENSSIESDAQIAERQAEAKKAVEIQAVIAPYFRCHEVFACFIKYDISSHGKNRDAKLSAFRRWINVADKLVAKHNYDGACLVLYAIAYMAKPSFLSSLPEHYQRRYEALDALFTPLHSFQNLRTRLDTLKHVNLLRPLQLCTRDMESIHGVLEGDMSITGRQSSEIQLRRLTRGFRNIDMPIEPISVHLVDSYEAMCRLVPTFRPESSMSDMFAATPIGEPGSKLYTHKLAPTFWRNRASQTDAMWETLLPLSSSASYIG